MSAIGGNSARRGVVGPTSANGVVHPMHHHTDPALHGCIELCWSCRDTCQSMLFNHCLAKGGPHVAPDHVRLMTDCIQICQTSADFMTRNSALHSHICV